MANMCDNTFSITTTEKPSWFKVDPETSHGISIPNDDRFLFLYDSFEAIEIKMSSTEDNKPLYTLEFGFETKWAPPIDFYSMLLEDETVVSFSASWYEPGCDVLGYVNLEEWIVDEDCPDHYYSDVLDCDVVAEQPSDTWVDMNGDNYMLLSDYLIKIQERRDAIPSSDVAWIQTLYDESIEIKEYFE